MNIIEKYIFFKEINLLDNKLTQDNCVVYNQRNLDITCTLSLVTVILLLFIN